MLSIKTPDLVVYLQIFENYQLLQDPSGEGLVCLVNNITGNQNVTELKLADEYFEGYAIMIILIICPPSGYQLP